ncbi:MAG: hypothetical protein ABL901_05505 [Hyphomicrobiaceae bacterium]
MATAADPNTKHALVSSITALPALADLILLRVALPGGATRAELARDLRVMTLPDLAPAAWRRATDSEFAELSRLGLVEEARARFKSTQPGSDHAAHALSITIGPKTTWAEVRDGPLTARALGLDTSDKSVLKALANPDNLRGLIVQRAFGLGDSKVLSLAKLRASLAVRALERAFGNQIKSGLGSGGGLAAKPSRLLAGQLLKTPRDYTSDGRLIAALAAEHLGTPNSEAETLRASLLRRAFLDRVNADSAPRSAPVPAGPAVPGVVKLLPAVSATKAVVEKAVVANDRGVANERPLPAARPDLPGFIKCVLVAAARRAEGWPGNRKAFISHVWQEIKSNHHAWALSEIEFKGMLAEAHRTGGLALANADLKDKKHIQEFENSAIQYKNTVWHFVRVEEA